MSKSYDSWLLGFLSQRDQQLWRQWAQTPPCSQCPAEKLHKCCTYEPWLPNFLIGAALDQGCLDWAQLSLEHLYVWTPLGRLPRINMLLWQKQGGRLGDPQGPLCSFFVKGSCAIWPHNGSQCRSYFCQAAHSNFSASPEDSFFFNLADPGLNRIYERWHQKESESAFEALACWALGTRIITRMEQMGTEYFALNSMAEFQAWQKKWYPPTLATWGWPNQTAWWAEAPHFYRFCYQQILG